MEQVYLVRCNQYDPPTIAAGVRSAAQGLGLSLPQGQPTLLHPTCSWAHPRFAPHAFTHPAVIEGVALALSAYPLTIATSSIPDFPTRYSYRQAGYVQLAQRLRATLVALDEVATQTVPLRADSVVDKEVALPTVSLQAPFTVALPKLTGSTFVPFAGAIRHHQSLLQQPAQTQGHCRLPDKMVDLLAAAPPKLIVVDAIQVAHDGGELSGRPFDLGVLIVGTNPVAVDAVCAVAYGLAPPDVQYLQLAADRGYGPADLSQIELRGDLTLDALRALGQGILHIDPYPENYPLPPQVKVLRSPKAELAGTAGGLTEVFLLFDHGGMPWSKARETVLVLGALPTVPAGTSDVATIIFLDDTSRADQYSGYTRVIRLRGRDIPLSTLLNDVPYAMQVGNLRNALGGEMVIASFAAKVAKLVKGR
jgi:uncharacterized protein (DUF362 family)